MTPYHFGLPNDEYERRNGVWHWHGHECQGADAETFTPCNNVWAIDAKGVFKQDKRLRAKNSDNCRVLNLLFVTDGEQVYYIEGVAKAVTNASAFRVLDAGRYLREDGSERCFGYARDDRFVYSHDFFSGAPKVLKHADVESFRVLPYGFGKDNGRVWKESQCIKGAAPASFQPVNDLYSRDAQHAYYDATVLRGLNPERLRFYPNKSGTSTVATDGRLIFDMRNLLEDADPETFVVETEPWGFHRDAHYVYWGGTRVPQADPETFERIGESHYYRDHTHVYYCATHIEGADLASFKVEDGHYDRAHDRDSKYHKHLALSGES